MGEGISAGTVAQSRHARRDGTTSPVRARRLTPAGEPETTIGRPPRGAGRRDRAWCRLRPRRRRAPSAAASAALSAGVVGARGRVGRAGALERLELLAEVDLQPRAVLALEGPQVVDLAGERSRSRLEVAEQLRTTLGRLAVERLRAAAGVRLHLVGVGLGLGLEPLGLGAGLADDLVGLALGVLDQLVGVAAGQLEQAGRGVGGVADGLDPDRLDPGGRDADGRDRRRRRPGSGSSGWARAPGLRPPARASAPAARARRPGPRGAALGGGQLRAEVVVLAGEARELGLHLVEELVDLTHVVALAEPDRSKALVAHVLRRQRHDLTQFLVHDSQRIEQ